MADDSCVTDTPPYCVHDDTIHLKKKDLDNVILNDLSHAVHPEGAEVAPDDMCPFVPTDPLRSERTMDQFASDFDTTVEIPENMTPIIKPNTVVAIEPSTTEQTNDDNYNEDTEWGEFESNCSVASGENETQGTRQDDVDMISVVVQARNSSPKPNSPLLRPIPPSDSGNSADPTLPGTIPTSDSGSNGDTTILPIPSQQQATTELDTTSISLKRNDRRVKFGKDQVALYETTSSPNHILTKCDMSATSTKLTYSDGSVYEGDVRCVAMVNLCRDSVLIYFDCVVCVFVYDIVDSTSLRVHCCSVFRDAGMATVLAHIPKIPSCTRAIGKMI